MRLLVDCEFSGVVRRSPAADRRRLAADQPAGTPGLLQHGAPNVAEADRQPLMLTFDPATHTYRYDGRVVPSVTQVLHPYSGFARMSEDQLAPASLRGTQVHEACEFDDQDDLDEESLTPELHGYVNAWRRFRADWQFTPTLIEHRVFNQQRWYAGTLDRWGTGVRPSDKRKKKRNILLDIKSGVEDKTHGIQVCAYAHALTDHRTESELTVYLRPDGTYKAVEYSDPDRLAVWISALTLHFWKARNV